MEKYSMFMCNLSDFFDWLNTSDLIVCKHYADQNCIRTDRCFNSFRTDNTILIYIQISHFISSLLEIFSCMKDCMMFNLCCNDMFSL